MQDKARIAPQHLEQVATVGNAVRDPRGWSLSTFYLALLAPDTELQGDDLRFVPLAEVLREELPLPFDHAQLVAQAAERLAGKAVYTSLPLYLLASRFTVTEALAAFQASLGQAVQHTTLRGRLEKMKQHGWILDTGEKNQPKMGVRRACWSIGRKPAGGSFLIAACCPEVNLAGLSAKLQKLPDSTVARADGQWKSPP